MTKQYEVVQRLAGEYYQRSTHETEWEAREAAIEATKVASTGYLGYPYRFGVRLNGRILTEDAMADQDAIHDYQRQINEACNPYRHDDAD